MEIKINAINYPSGNFLAGYKQGTILKKLCPAEEKALEAIKKDILRPYVPTYMGVVSFLWLCRACG